MEKEQIDEIERLAVQAQQCEPELLEWIQEQAEGAMQGRLEAGRDNSSSASTLLLLLLAGFGGAFAYAVRLFDRQSTVLSWGAAATCAFLAMLAAVLFFKCLKLADSPAVYNEPRNLLEGGGKTLADVRPGAVAGLQRRLDAAQKRNAARARWLDLVRVASLLTPFAFAVGAAAYLIR